MLWSKPVILYDTILNYRTEDHVSWLHYWKLKQDKTLTVVHIGQKVCVATVPSEINQTSILWQHLFLTPLLKDMQTGWHICLLPRQMIVVIKDGLYICERLTSGKDEQIESTKTYMYRFGYEPDVPVQVHDWREASETVSVPPRYKGFILEPYKPWYKRVQDISLSLFKLLSPHTTIILGATLLSLTMGSLYYGYQNYAHGLDRLHVLKAWPAIQSSKARVNQLLQLMGLFIEARTPASLVQVITVNDKGILIQCDSKFPADKNVEVMRQFLKKYYPYDARVLVGHPRQGQLKGTPDRGTMNHIEIAVQ